jgi:RNA polymerase sigma-70 factor (ECF subfamily)
VEKQCDVRVVIQIPIEVWLEGARTGSPDALGLALEACRADLLAMASHALGPALWSKGDQADLVQETFLEAARDFHQFQGRSAGEWRAWLRQIFAHNLQHQVRRYRGTAKRQVDQEISIEQLDRWGRGLDTAEAQDWSTPSAHAMKKEWEEQLAEALAQLPERDRRVLQLRFLERRTLEEIGLELGCTPAAVGKACRKALERLRIELDLSRTARQALPPLGRPAPR